IQEPQPAVVTHRCGQCTSLHRDTVFLVKDLEANLFGTITSNSYFYIGMSSIQKFFHKNINRKLFYLGMPWIGMGDYPACSSNGAKPAGLFRATAPHQFT